MQAAPAYWHVTSVDRLDAILRDGLRPRSAHDADAVWNECIAVDESSVYLSSARSGALGYLELLCESGDNRRSFRPRELAVIEIDPAQLDSSLLFSDPEDVLDLALNGVTFNETHVQRIIGRDAFAELLALHELFGAPDDPSWSRDKLAACVTLMNDLSCATRQSLLALSLAAKLPYDHAHGVWHRLAYRSEVSPRAIRGYRKSHGGKLGRLTRATVPV